MAVQAETTKMTATASIPLSINTTLGHHRPLHESMREFPSLPPCLDFSPKRARSWSETLERIRRVDDVVEDDLHNDPSLCFQQHSQPQHSISSSSISSTNNNNETAVSTLRKRGTVAKSDSSTVSSTYSKNPLSAVGAVYRRHLGRRQSPPSPQQRQQQRRRWLIPAEHPLKILWDIITLVLSLCNAYITNQNIQERRFGSNIFIHFCECWFVFDMLLNFVTEYRAGDGMVLTECKAVWGQYLTGWFVVDALSLVPAEYLFLQPAIERARKRGFFQKYFFRSKVVMRITRVLRGRHFKLFGQVARQTKRAGMGGYKRLLHFLIRILPKYIFFLRNNKAVMAFRALRNVHWFSKIWQNLPAAAFSCLPSSSSLYPIKTDNETHSLTYVDYDDEDYHYYEKEDEREECLPEDNKNPTLRSQDVQLVFAEGWKTRRYNPYDNDDDTIDSSFIRHNDREHEITDESEHDDDDDGAPF